MLHAIQTDQRSRAAETCFTVNGDCTGLRVREVLLACVNEVLNDISGWRRPINKNHVVVCYVLLLKLRLIVLRLIESDDSSNI